VVSLEGVHWVNQIANLVETQVCIHKLCPFDLSRFLNARFALKPLFLQGKSETTFVRVVKVCQVIFLYSYKDINFSKM